MRRRHVIVLATFATFVTAAAVVACTLNPQPLPPRDNEATFGDASAGAEAGFGGGPAPVPADASPGRADDEGGSPNANDDGGDAGGDAGDGGDAAADAG